MSFNYLGKCYYITMFEEEIIMYMNYILTFSYLLLCQVITLGSFYLLVYSLVKIYYFIA